MNLNNLPNGCKRGPGEFEPEQPTLIKRVVRSYGYDLGYSIDELCKLLVVRSGKFMKYYCDEPIPDRAPRFRLIQNP
jgi:hypothetical protein